MEGKKQFEDSTAAASLEPYKEYEVHNVLIFYTDVSGEIGKKLEKAVGRLKE